MAPVGKELGGALRAFDGAFRHVFQDGAAVCQCVVVPAPININSTPEMQQRQNRQTQTCNSKKKNIAQVGRQTKLDQASNNKGQAGQAEKAGRSGRGAHSKSPHSSRIASVLGSV